MDISSYCTNLRWGEGLNWDQDGMYSRYNVPILEWQMSGKLPKKLYARKGGHIMTLWSASAHFFSYYPHSLVHNIHPNISNLTMRWEINGNGGKRARAMTKMCVELMSISWGEIITAICIGAGKIDGRFILVWEEQKSMKFGSIGLRGD